MCEERERLIGFVFDDCDPTERRAIEDHLSSCPACRREIRGLRSARQDLLAWDVPAHEPVWRPMAPARAESLWRALPAWAMTAAAGATLMIGAAGGAATYALLPQPAQPVARVAEPGPAAIGSPDLAALAAIEARVLELMRAELDDRVSMVSAGIAAPAAGRSDADMRELASRIDMLRSRQEEMSGILSYVATETIGIRSRQSDVERNNRLLASYIEGPQSVMGGR
jgi:hypothetical protein